MTYHARVGTDSVTMVFATSTSGVVWPPQLWIDWHVTWRSSATQEASRVGWSVLRSWSLEQRCRSFVQGHVLVRGLVSPPGGGEPTLVQDLTVQGSTITIGKDRDVLLVLFDCGMAMLGLDA